MLQIMFFDNEILDLVIVCVILVIISIWCEALVSSRFRVTPQGFAEYIKNKVLGLTFLFRGTSIIDDGYRKAKGKPFTIQTLGNQLILVTSERHIKELDRAPPDQLSLHAFAKEALHPKYIIGFQWPDQRNIEGVPFVRAVKSATTELPALFPSLCELITEEMERAISLSKNIGGYQYIKLLAVIEKIVARANCLFLFENELSRNRHFVEATIEYQRNGLLTAEILGMIPSFLVPLTARILSGRLKSRETVFNYLGPLIQQRLESKLFDKNKSQREKPVDFLQCLIETSPKQNPWTVERTIHEIITVWLPTILTMSIITTQAIQDLCINQEYIEILRQEQEKMLDKESVTCFDALPMLDSFVKESARINCFEAVSGRRKAIRPFTFSGGVNVAKGNWVSVPQRAISHDPRYYLEPMEFNGMRFLDGNNGNPSRFADSSNKWHFWGCGKLLCPGRQYASLVIKLILATIVQKYDFKLKDKKAQLSMTWRSATIPLSSTVLLMKPRERIPVVS